MSGATSNPVPGDCAAPRVNVAAKIHALRAIAYVIPTARLSPARDRMKIAASTGVKQGPARTDKSAREDHATATAPVSPVKLSVTPMEICASALRINPENVPAGETRKPAPSTKSAARFHAVATTPAKLALWSAARAENNLPAWVRMQTAAPSGILARLAPMVKPAIWAPASATTFAKSAAPSATLRDRSQTARVLMRPVATTGAFCTHARTTRHARQMPAPAIRSASLARPSAVILPTLNATAWAPIRPAACSMETKRSAARGSVACPSMVVACRIRRRSASMSTSATTRRR